MLYFQATFATKYQKETREMHPIVLFCAKAHPLILAVEAATKLEYWVLHGHDEFTSEIDTMAFASYYGRTKNSEGGGLAIELDIVTGDEAEGVDRLDICFSFGRDDIDSAIRFVCDLDSNKWTVRHEQSEGIKRRDGDPSVPLAKQLRLVIDGNYRTIENTETAMAMLAIASDYTFEHCND